MRDPHEILGISRAASEEEIKRAFRQKAKHCHPDTHPNDSVLAREFRDLVSAYRAALKNRQQRNQGKSFSEELAKASGTARAAASQRQPSSSDHHEYRYEDTIDLNSHRDSHRRNPHQESADNAADRTTSSQQETASVIDVLPAAVKSFWQDTIMGTFEEMVRQNLQHNPQTRAGVDKANEKAKPRQEGKNHHYTLDVGFIEARQGSQKNLLIQDGRRISVKISPETREGQTLRLSGLGQSGTTTQKPGDALVTINIVDDQFCERSDNDFFLRLPITLTEAVLGGEITVPGLYQDNIVTIPPNSSSGTNLRLKGQGFRPKSAQKNSRKGKNSRKNSGENGSDIIGDQYVTLDIKLPLQPEKRLEAFIGAWSSEYDYDVRQNIGLGSLDSRKKNAHNGGK